MESTLPSAEAHVRVARTRRTQDNHTRSLPLTAPQTMAAFLLFIAAGLWYLQPSLGPWPLLLVVAAFVIHTVVTGSILPHSAFDGPLLVFLLGAVMASWLAVDRPAAFQTTFWIYVGAVVMYFAMIFMPPVVRIGNFGRIRPLHLFLAALPAVIALYFILTTDWSTWQVKVGWLGPLIPFLDAWSVTAPGHLLHPNLAGGLIAVFIPLQVGAIRLSPRTWPYRVVGITLVGISLLGLLITTSRGAWLALLAVAGLWGSWWFCGLLARWLDGGPAEKRMQTGLWVGTVVVGVLAVVVVLWMTAVGDLAMSAAQSRLALWNNSLALALDTPLTGIGSDSFQMAYVTYALLMHVGYQPHSHNMLLEIWLRQGLLGLIALAWIAATVVRLRRSPSNWRPWALAALGVMAIHALVDIPFYGGRGLMLAFVPLALLARDSDGNPLSLPVRGNLRLALLGTAVAIAAALVFLPAGQSILRANLGASAQTRAELARYTWPEWPIQDELRRSPEIDLAPAIAQYQAALVANPNNPVANRRLAQIELARGDYASARIHLEAAYAAAPGQRATRQLLGELYAIDGETTRAAELLSTVDTDLNQMDLRVFWYTHIGEREKTDRLRQFAGG